MFALGTNTVTADVNGGGIAHFTDLGDLSSLDYITLSLFQTSDANNVLWEYRLNTCDAATSQPARGIVVETSQNTQSNAIHSFVVVPPGREGAINESQIPIRLQVLDELHCDQEIQWKVTIPSHTHQGTIDLVRTDGEWTTQGDDQIWTSTASSAPADLILEFYPQELAPRHIPEIYTQGKGAELINEKQKNPLLTYHVEVSIGVPGQAPTITYEEQIAMDLKDAIRQEYVNHYNSLAFTSNGSGTFGAIPAPTRGELVPIPPTPPRYAGGAWSESAYGLMVDGQMQTLAEQVDTRFQARQAFYRDPANQLLDLNNAAMELPLAQVGLNLNSGWRNPERNEFYSTAINSRHQLGNAVDLGFTEDSYNSVREEAALYQILWEAAQSVPARFKQLEDGGVSVNNQLGRDSDPANGIVDAFDNADHLHID